MILFFGNPAEKIYTLQVANALSPEDVKKLNWLFGNQPQINSNEISGQFIGPRAAMITPWSTNAVEITQNMTIKGIERIEEFNAINDSNTNFDPMLFQKYDGLKQDIFTINIQPEAVKDIENISAYNQDE